MYTHIQIHVSITDRVIAKNMGSITSDLASVPCSVQPSLPRIQLRLRTQNTVNTGGELRILAPLEFGFDPDPDAPLIQGDKQTRCLIDEYESLGLLDDLNMIWI